MTTGLSVTQDSKRDTKQNTVQESEEDKKERARTVLSTPPDVVLAELFSFFFKGDGTGHGHISLTHFIPAYLL
jgi:hypothetical protein